MRGGRLLIDVEGGAGGELHAGGHLEVGDAGVELQFIGPGGTMLAVQLVQQPHAIRSTSGRTRRAWPQVQDRHPLGAELHALVQGRHPAARPVADAIDRQPARIGQDDIRGQVLVLGAERVGDPRTDRRPTGDDHAGVHHPARLLVIAMLREHRANDGDLVRVLRDVRQRLGELGAALAVLAKAKRALEQVAGDAFIVGDLSGRRLAVVAIEHRLGVEQIDLARPAVHEELDDGAGLRREVRLPETNVMGCAVQIGLQQRREHEPAEPPPARPRTSRRETFGFMDGSPPGFRWRHCTPAKVRSPSRNPVPV